MDRWDTSGEIAGRGAVHMLGTGRTGNGGTVEVEARTEAEGTAEASDRWGGKLD